MGKLFDLFLEMADDYLDRLAGSLFDDPDKIMKMLQSSNGVLSVGDLINLPEPELVGKMPEIISDTCLQLESIQKTIEEVAKKGAAAKRAARSAAELSADWDMFGSNKKKAIEGLQRALRNVVEAQDSQIEAEALLFINQKKLSQAIGSLLLISSMSIAINRAAVKGITEKLNNATNQVMGDFEKQELNNLLVQLKAQENLLSIVEKHSVMMNDYRKRIERLENQTSVRPFH